MDDKVKKLLVDVDGVIGDMIVPILYDFNKRTGRNVLKSSIHRYDYKDGAIDVHEEVLRLQARPENMSRVPLVDGAKEALAALKKLYAITIVTARPPELEAATRFWLLNHDIRLPLVFNRRKWEMRGDFLVDDSPSIARKWAETGRTALLFAQPWNSSGDLLLHIRRVHGWAAVRSYLERRAQ